MAAVIRLMRPEDERQIRRMVMRYLKETYEQGGDFPPTLDNAATFAMYAIQGAQEGDPCLVADDDGRLVGFVAARGVHFPGMQTRHKTVRSWGTYVAPDYRRKGLAVQLYLVAGRTAKWAGYTRFLGMTHGSGYEEAGMKVGLHFRAMKVVGSVLMMDLTRPASDEAEETPVVEEEAEVEAIEA